MISPSNTELPDKQQLVFAWRKYNDEDITFEEAEADIDRYIQAREQQLLTELLGELPEEYTGWSNFGKRDLSDKEEGFNGCRKQVVSVIQRLQNKTNDGGS